MPKKSTPVLVYRPGQTNPVRAGIFSWSSDTRVGEFTYDADYLKSEKAISLDPMSLRFKRSTIKEAKQDGIFGVFRDAGPDAWGRDQLYRDHGDLDEFDYLLQGPADGVGNVAFGEEPEELKAYSLVALDDVSRGFPPDDNQIANAINPTTSMGGAKPKLLVEDEGFFWIAKFPEKGDPVRFLAANEHVMLEMAKDCGIDAATSRLHTLPDGRQIILVRRFDLTPASGGVTRKGFASAYTVLGLGNPKDDAKKKSYLRFSDETMRWTGRQYGRDIWQRLVYNAMVGNVDDHPRNHALIFDTSGWQLSPAFDIVASDRRDHVALCMRFHLEGAVATPETLLFSALLLGIDPEEAITAMTKMAKTILNTWRVRFERIGADAENMAKLEGAFKMARLVLDHDFKLIETQSKRSRARYRPA
ncbi:MAG: type II toxin-antitoxin system HipA family toxin [Propionivibrio sp.]